ncbi:Zinc finger CCCH domain-containing protein 18 [Apostasia shenzhenica]|uniref:Zinc finger CCCH domain-containing protein 18 n=1 Tax=Apostasia shenzhenica TaxID=1088818 RepID=A0A2I0A2R5_9ASPA|nr:Zinc finger CCCH domain-containing protein 18 [Apostasia shenzhenica]
MEISQCSQLILQRIQKVEPENAIRIFGYLLLKHGPDDIFEYAVGSEEQIHSLVAEAKSYLVSSHKLNITDQIQSKSSYNNNNVPRASSSPSSFRVPSPIYLTANQQPDFQNLGRFSPTDYWGMEEQLQPVSPSSIDPPGNFCFPDGSLASRSRSPSLNCHYFYNGYCKHGESCKFSHGQENSDSYSQPFPFDLNEFPCEDYSISPMSLRKLELEVTELLKAMRGLPVSVASLPMFYQDVYGKALQSEGYLTESQRHGKAGFSLTKLLARMRNIRLIERPHGQHSVVLAEDFPKYMEFRAERNELGDSSSHQIYLTFPAESTFTDFDVQSYFSQFGPVRDVRIPRQEKRMFGFVSFYYADTVRQILAMGHPHHINGARVLVKPYKEKSRLVDRKYGEKLDAQTYLSSINIDKDNFLALQSSLGQRSLEASLCCRKQLIEEQERALDLDRRFLKMQLGPRPAIAQPFIRYGSDDTKSLEDRLSSLSFARDKTTDVHEKSAQGNNHDSLQIQLPESPFASPRF